MKVAIIGSRDYDDKATEFIKGCVLKLGSEDYIVSGGALGADSWAEAWARSVGVGRIIHEANWRDHGKAAGPIRNAKVIREADVVLAFYSDKSKSKGTVHAVGLARKAGIPVYEFDALTEDRPSWYDTWYEQVREAR